MIKVKFSESSTVPSLAKIWTFIPFVSALSPGKGSSP